jgi:hypothetical protein
MGLNWTTGQIALAVFGLLVFGSVGMAMAEDQPDKPVGQHQSVVDMDRHAADLLTTRQPDVGLPTPGLQAAAYPATAAQTTYDVMLIPRDGRGRPHVWTDRGWTAVPPDQRWRRPSQPRQFSDRRRNPTWRDRGFNSYRPDWQVRGPDARSVRRYARSVDPATGYSRWR